MKKSTKKNQRQKPDLAKEVSTLANQIASALKTAKDSDELKGIGRDTEASLRNAGNRIVSAIKMAKESNAMKDIKTQSRKVLDIGKIKSEKSVRNAGQNLARGLHHIGKELQNIAEQLKKK